MRHWRLNLLRCFWGSVYTLYTTKWGRTHTSGRENFLLHAEINSDFVIEGEDINGAVLLWSDPLLAPAHGENRGLLHCRFPSTKFLQQAVQVWTGREPYTTYWLIHPGLVLTPWEGETISLPFVLRKDGTVVAVALITIVYFHTESGMSLVAVMGRLFRHIGETWDGVPLGISSSEDPTWVWIGQFTRHIYLFHISI